LCAFFQGISPPIYKNWCLTIFNSPDPQKNHAFQKKIPADRQIESCFSFYFLVSTNREKKFMIKKCPNRIVVFFLSEKIVKFGFHGFSRFKKKMDQNRIVKKKTFKSWFFGLSRIVRHNFVYYNTRGDIPWLFVKLNHMQF
jgi:hypothetical protein